MLPSSCPGTTTEFLSRQPKYWSRASQHCCRALRSGTPLVGSVADLLELENHDDMVCSRVAGVGVQEETRAPFRFRLGPSTSDVIPCTRHWRFRIARSSYLRCFPSFGSQRQGYSLHARRGGLDQGAPTPREGRSPSVPQLSRGWLQINLQDKQALDELLKEFRPESELLVPLERGRELT